jgi:plastocyanin
MKRRRSVTLLVLVALAIPGLAACGGGSSASCPAKIDTKTATGGDVTICASDTHFDVNTIRVPVGVLNVKLLNDGAAYHTFKLSKTSLYLKANSGKTAEGSVTLSRGTYTFECTVPGHASAGMKGTIVVGHAAD